MIFLRFIALTVFVVLNTNAGELYICNTKYIVSDGKKYLPPDNLKKIVLKIGIDRNTLVFKTKNMQSTYYYKGFIRPTEQIPSIGVSFENNGRFIDLYNNNLLWLSIYNDDVSFNLEAECPSMNLGLRENSITSEGYIMYGFPLGKD